MGELDEFNNSGNENSKKSKQATDEQKLQIYELRKGGYLGDNLTDDNINDLTDIQAKKIIETGEKRKASKGRAGVNTDNSNTVGKSLSSPANGNGNTSAQQTSSSPRGNPDQSMDRETAEHEAAVEFDIMDSSQIVDMLEGRTNQKLIYSFPMGGHTVEGVSYAGTLDAGRYYSEQMVAHGYAPLDTVDYNLIESTDAFRAFVRVKDGRSGMTIPGYASQPKKMKKYTNRERTECVFVEDEKADVKAVSKATRNALRNAMPPNFIDAYIVAVKKGLRK